MPALTRLAAAAALVLAAPHVAHAQAPALSLAVDRPCYSEQDTIAFSGSGYTPGGGVAVSLGAAGQLLGADFVAGPDGTLAGEVAAPDPDLLLDAQAEAAEVVVTAEDQARIAAGGFPPASQAATATLTLSRWDVVGLSRTGRIDPRRPITWRAVGFTADVGRPLYLHFRLRGRTVKTVRLGLLAGPCGDLERRLRRAFPFRANAGRYTLVSNPSRRNARARPAIVFRARVR